MCQRTRLSISDAALGLALSSRAATLFTLLLCVLHPPLANAVSADELDDVRAIFAERCTFRDYATFHEQVQCAERNSPSGPALEVFERLASQVESHMRAHGISDYDARVNLLQLLSQEQRNLNSESRAGALPDKPQLTAQQQYALKNLRGCLSDQSALAMEVTCLHSTYMSSGAMASFIEPLDRQAQQLLQAARSNSMPETEARRQLWAAVADRDGGPAAPQTSYASHVNERRYSRPDPAPRPTFAERFRQGLQAAQEAPLAPYKQKCAAFGFAQGTPEFAQCVQQQYNAAQPGRPITCMAGPVFLQCQQ